MKPKLYLERTWEEKLESVFSFRKGVVWHSGTVAPTPEAGRPPCWRLESRRRRWSRSELLSLHFRFRERKSCVLWTSLFRFPFIPWLNSIHACLRHYCVLARVVALGSQIWSNWTDLMDLRHCADPFFQLDVGLVLIYPFDSSFYNFLAILTPFNAVYTTFLPKIL
jgi:hypothetical protein